MESFDFSDDLTPTTPNDDSYSPEQLDIKYKPFQIDDSPIIDCEYIKFEKLVTLLNGNIAVSPPNPLVDITVLFSVEKKTNVDPLAETTTVKEHYYISLGDLLQKVTITWPYLWELFKLIDSHSKDLARQLIQLTIKFLSPKVLKQ